MRYYHGLATTALAPVYAGKSFQSVAFPDRFRDGDAALCAFRNIEHRIPWWDSDHYTDLLAATEGWWIANDAADHGQHLTLSGDFYQNWAQVVCVILPPVELIRENFSRHPLAGTSTAFPTLDVALRDHQSQDNHARAMGLAVMPSFDAAWAFFADRVLPSTEGDVILPKWQGGLEFR